MLDSVKERALYGDSHFPEVNRRLQIVTEEELVASKATWHRICYQQTTNKELIRWAKERYERKKSDLGAPTSAEVTNNSTRRSLCPMYEKKNCFFCDEEGSKRHPLHKVATFNAGKNLKDAVNLNNNDKLKVRLNEALNPLDAHAIDVLYHKKCWAINVSNLLRQKRSDYLTKDSEAVEAVLATEIEFLSLLEGWLTDGNIITMVSLQSTYMNIASENGCEYPDISRKKLKDLIMEEIPNVEFCKPRKANESERVVLKSTRDFAIAEAEVRDESLSDELKSLFDAAKILRKAVIDSEKWEFTGDLTNANEKHVPNKLVHFFSWFIRGASDIKDEKKKILVEKRTQSLAQNTIYACLSPRKVLKLLRLFTIPTSYPSN